MPPEGVAKGPPPSEADLRKNRLYQAGQQVGIDFTYKCPRYPYTLPAHVLIDHTGEKHGEDKQNELMELIFKAYFTDGLYPDADTLSTLAGQVGLDKDEVRSLVTNEDLIKKAKDRALSWSKRGVSGVPCFFINKQEVFSGAQEPEAFQHVFRVIAEKFPLHE